jgi:hypothetical protein
MLFLYVVCSADDGEGRYLKGSYFATPAPSGSTTPHQRLAAVQEDQSLGRVEGTLDGLGA